MILSDTPNVRAICSISSLYAVAALPIPPVCGFGQERERFYEQSYIFTGLDCSYIQNICFRQLILCAYLRFFLCRYLLFEYRMTALVDNVYLFGIYLYELRQVVCFVG